MMPTIPLELTSNACMHSLQSPLIHLNLVHDTLSFQINGWYRSCKICIEILLCQCRCRVLQTQQILKWLRTSTLPLICPLSLYSPNHISSTVKQNIPSPTNKICTLQTISFDTKSGASTNVHTPPCPGRRSVLYLATTNKGITSLSLLLAHTNCSIGPYNIFKCMLGDIWPS